jgi:hypothetical protein
LGQSSGIDNGKNGVEWSIISSEAPKKYFWTNEVTKNSSPDGNQKIQPTNRSAEILI